MRRIASTLCRTLLAVTWLLPYTALADYAEPPEPRPLPQAQTTPEGASFDESESSLFAAPTTHDRIGRVVLPVRINGRGPFRFVVDTGANHSTISPRLAEQLGLKADKLTGRVMLDGVTGTGQVSVVRVEALQAGDFSTGETDLPVVWAPVMAGADGIFGAAALASKSLVVDFQRNRVAISRHVDSAVRDGAMRIRAPRITQGLVTVAARIDGIDVTAVIDTGSERSLGNAALKAALARHRPTGAMALVTSVYGATEDRERGEIERVPPIRIDALRIEDVAVVFGAFHIFKVWDMEDRPAMILGMDVLGTVSSLGIDFQNEYVYLTSAHARAEPSFATAGALAAPVQKH